ncbi:CaiB/BaiF CoA transferase family protein [Rhizobium jaguaris]|uniref:CoA transferase n=1 Tax=Rhizobium jaguaris TaxID=1312183 RepID=A0A387FYM0_9HYPH|nr:CoA transferase [Rhizobium jaguaris]AYG60961.1 CoA transferase [Rhizobium jaguaris]
MPGALDDLRVVDFSDNLGGQYCARLFADFGAEVILVEPEAGSRIRRMPPFPVKDSGLSQRFWHLNTGKRSVSLDRQGSEGRARLDALLASADVAILPEDFDAAEVEKINPQCVAVTVSPFGKDGPLKDWKAPEIVLQALSGMMNNNGEFGREPLYGVGDRASFAAGVAAYIGIMAALSARSADGKGQAVSVDIEETAAAMCFPYVLRHIYNSSVHRRNDQTIPAGQVKCRDGWVCIWIYNHRWYAVCTALDLPEMERDARFADPAIRRRNWDAMFAIIQEKVADLAAEDLVERLQQAQVIAAKAYRPSEQFGNAHLNSRNYWESVDGRVILGPPFRMSETPRRVRAGAPDLGEANRDLDGFMGHPRPSRVAALPPQNEDGAGFVPGGRSKQGAVASGQTIKGIEATAKLGNSPHPEAQRPQAGASKDEGRQGTEVPHLPLQGIRVIEITTAWAGPMAGRVLCYFGAESIHVESPNRVNSWRLNKEKPNPINFPDGEPGERFFDRSFLFNSQNVNKLSCILNLKTEEGRQTLRRLVAVADVLICNFRPGTLAKLGLDYDNLTKIKPDIIVAELPAFGRHGPMSGYAALGPTMEMATGMSAMMGYRNGQPENTGPSYLDPIGGFNAAAAILTALHYRQRTGEGQYIEVPQVEAAMQLIGAELLLATETGLDPVPDGNHVAHMAPHDAFPAIGEDQWVVIAAEDETQWRALCAVMERPDLAEDSRFATLAARRANEDLLTGIIADWTRGRSKHEVARRLQEAGVAAAPVATAADLAGSDYLAHRGFFTELNHPDAGRHPYPGLPIHLSRTPGTQRSAAPQFGGDNMRVLRDILTLSDEEIDQLQASAATATVPFADG